MFLIALAYLSLNRLPIVVFIWLCAYTALTSAYTLNERCGIRHLGSELRNGGGRFTARNVLLVCGDTLTQGVQVTDYDSGPSILVSSQVLKSTSGALKSVPLLVWESDRVLRVEYAICSTAIYRLETWHDIRLNKVCLDRSGAVGSRLW